MLARSGSLPTGSGWSFELKWDGFRALVSTEDGLRVRSRRAFNMAPTVPELRRLPDGLVLDGELVAWKGRKPYFPNFCRRVPEPRPLGARDVRRVRPAPGRRHRPLRPLLRRAARPARQPRARRTGLGDLGDIRGWRRSVRERLRARARGCGREEARGSLSPWRAPLGEVQEPELLASGVRDRGSPAVARAPERKGLLRL